MWLMRLFLHLLNSVTASKEYCVNIPSELHSQSFSRFLRRNPSVAPICLASASAASARARCASSGGDRRSGGGPTGRLDGEGFTYDIHF